MEDVPGYVSVVFIVTAFASVAFLLHGIKSVGLESSAGRTFVFTLPLWIAFQCALSIGGFYQVTSPLPPRLFLFCILPALAFVAFTVVFFRSALVKRMPLSVLTVTHVVRVPVELTLHWLFLGKLLPREMTFEGWNFDIVSGVLGLVTYLVVFRFGFKSRALLAAFNILGLLLLVNIVVIANLSMPTPLQRMAFDQPDRALLMFPYTLLPAVIVPIVLFSHILSLVKICQTDGTLR